MSALPSNGCARGRARRLAVILVAASWLALGALPSAAQAPAAAQAAAERRVALVIGNNAYQGVTPLANPVYDARAFGAKLAQLGFEVISVENGTKRQMERALESFSKKLGPDAVSLFYYAGHAIQVNSHNYLLPVDAEIATEQTVRLETVDVDAVIDQMAMARSRANLVILDACRNNPYERRFRSQSGGLASIDAPTGTMIAYATAPGKVAADGTGAHGLYTSELLAAMDMPGAKVEEVFKRVRERVVKKSHGEQTPWESSSLMGDFYFRAPSAAPLSPSATEAPADREVVYWTSVKDSRDPALLQAYLDEFPQGTFAGAARIMIEELKRTQTAALPAEPAPALVAGTRAAAALEEIAGAYITVKRASVRERPVADARLIKELEPGVPLKVTGRVKDTGWYRVASADDKLRGFVAGDAIQDIEAAEAAEWQRVKDAKNGDLVAAFLKRYPAGAYAELAKVLRDGLAAEEKQALAGALAGPAAAGRLPANAGGYPVGVGQSFRDCADCPEMVVIPPGEFLMGSETGGPNENPLHRVRVGQALAVGKYHVTRGEYARFVQATGYAADGGRWRDPGVSPTERDPVVNVSWDDAKAYAAWLSRRTGKGYRLLTEAEWEYAARAGTTTQYWWGDGIGRNRANCDGCGSAWDSRSTAPAGSFAANAFGLYDMLGNAWQWVEDCWTDTYANAPNDASIAPASAGDCARHALRGGSWNNFPGYLRAAARITYISTFRNEYVGFRVARTPSG